MELVQRIFLTIPKLAEDRPVGTKTDEEKGHMGQNCGLLQGNSPFFPPMFQSIATTYFNLVNIILVMGDPYWSYFL